MSRCRRQVRNKLTTSRCNGISETTRHKRHIGLLSAPTRYGLVVDITPVSPSKSITSWQLPHLRGSYGGIRV